MKNVSHLTKAVLFLGALAAIGPFRAAAEDASNPWPKDPYYANNRKPDSRLKVDLLVVVAHPDDEVMTTAYVIRAIEQGKRVALVWTVRGNGGTNEVGPEQSEAMADIRVMEGMKAGAFMGVTAMWNLEGFDTPTQNPLESLDASGHGRLLDRMVRIVRITRPTVILTWLPLGVTGENHGDHQACGILSTEAFDMAGDPTAFPEQVAPAREPLQNSNRTEGLRPWQPQKLYFFCNPTHMDFFSGQGPEYSSTEISPSRKTSYGEAAARGFVFHGTQGGVALESAIEKHALDGLEEPIPLTKPTRFILGKSLVKCGVTDDVFAGVVPGGIPFQRVPGYSAGAETAPTLKLGGPWGYCRDFLPAHGLERLGALVPPEVSIQVGGTLRLPMILENPLDHPIKVAFKVQAPSGWTFSPIPDATVEAHDRYFLRLLSDAPTTKLPGWQQFHVAAESDGTSIGAIDLRVELEGWALPQ